jgi:hypothetical protein
MLEYTDDDFKFIHSSEVAIKNLVELGVGYLIRLGFIVPATSFIGKMCF